MSARQQRELSLTTSMLIQVTCFCYGVIDSVNLFSLSRILVLPIVQYMAMVDSNQLQRRTEDGLRQRYNVCLEVWGILGKMSMVNFAFFMGSILFMRVTNVAVMSPVAHQLFMLAWVYPFCLLSMQLNTAKCQDIAKLLPELHLPEAVNTSQQSSSNSVNIKRVIQNQVQRLIFLIVSLIQIQVLFYLPRWPFQSLPLFQIVSFIQSCMLYSMYAFEPFLPQKVSFEVGSTQSISFTQIIRYLEQKYAYFIGYSFILTLFVYLNLDVLTAYAGYCLIQPFCLILAYASQPLPVSFDFPSADDNNGRLSAFYPQTWSLDSESDSIDSQAQDTKSYKLHSLMQYSLPAFYLSESVTSRVINLLSSYLRTKSQ
ncbi:hypothetical protein MP228_007573 [Amoeboaphelidium protococcarum]|nr:hypothetical protein MP228_007573 [Amoeboaphelidium protococcarum]